MRLSSRSLALVYVLCVFGINLSSFAATVTYTMQVPNFNSTQTTLNNNPPYAGTYNNGATELAQYANGGWLNNTPGAAAFQTFTTTGNGTTGTTRALQVGDTFTITGFVSANPSAGGRIGISFRDSTSYSNFAASTDSSTEARFQLDNTGGWKVYNNGTSVDSGLGSNADRTFTIKITSDNTFNATIGSTTYYDLAMAASGGTIDSFAIYTYGDSNQNSFWKNASLSDTGTVEFGNDASSGQTRTISGIIGNGLAANSTTSTVNNAVTISGAAGSQVNFSGNNTYSGATTINNNATLELQHANALGSTAAGTTVNSGGTLKVWSSSNLTTQAEALTLNGAGVNSGGALLNSGGNNTYAGTITLGSASRINSASGTLTLDVTSGNAINGTFQLNIGGAGSVTVNDNINISTAKLVKDGAGILTLGASNNYSGNTEVDAGEIWFSTGGSANSSKIWIGNGASMATTAKVWIQSGGTTISSSIDVNNGNIGTRVLGGLNATGTATYSGAIGVNNGDLNLEANNAGGTVEFTGAVTTSSGKYVTASGPGLVIFSGSGNNTGIGANVNSGTLRLAKTSSGSVRALNATPIVNNGGTLQFGGTGGDQLPDNVSVTINTGGRLDMNGVNETIGGFTLNGTGNSSTGAIINSSSTATTLTLGGQANLASDSSIGGTGDITISGNQRIVSSVVGTGRTLTKVGANTVTLANGTSTQDNTDLFVAVTAGKLVLAKASADGYHAAGGFTVNSGGTLQLDGSGGYQIWKGAGIATVNSGGTFDLNGQNQTFTSAGPTISGTGVSSGGALINSSTDASSTLSSAVILAGDSSVGGAGNLTISGIISESGGNRALTKVGTGTLTVSQNNSFAGNATINEGKVTMSHANGLGLGAITVNAGADLEVTGGITVARNLTLSAVNGAIRGGRLMSSGANQKNTYSGTVAVNNSEFDVASGNTLDVTGKISGTGTVTKTGAGELQLNNTGNDYSGITDVQNGTLTASSIANSGTASTIGAGSEVKVGSSANAGTFKYTGGTAGMNRTVTVGSAGGTINVNDNAATMTLNGTVAGSGNTLTKTGAGILAFGSGSSVSLSTIAVQQGTLLLGAANQVGATTGSASSLNLSAGTTVKTAFDLTGNVLTLAGTSAEANTIFDFNSGSGNDFTFGSTSWYGGNLKLSNVAVGTVINFGTFTGNAGLTFNDFQSKVSFTDTGLQAQINFSGTSLTVAAIPEPKVYVAAGALALLIGYAEVRRRKRAKSAV